MCVCVCCYSPKSPLWPVALNSVGSFPFGQFYLVVYNGNYSIHLPCSVMVQTDHMANKQSFRMTGAELKQNL